MNIPPISPRNLIIALIIGVAIYLVMAVLPGGPLHPQPRWNCADHGYIACCFSD